jgi:hypothetical protein
MSNITARDGPVKRRLNVHRDWRYDIPLKFLWAIYIYPKTTVMRQLGENIRTVINKYEITTANQWPVNTRCLEEISDPFGSFGLLLAQNIALPSDAFDISNTSIDGAAGWLGGQYAGNRQGYGAANKVDITFLETNIDIFDYFLRPWIIAASHKGLIEDGTTQEELKCDLQLIQFSRDAGSYSDVITPLKAKNSVSLDIRKVIEFYDAVPFQISGDSLSYGELGMNDITRTVSFSFNRYAVVNKNNIPVSNKLL